MPFMRVDRFRLKVYILFKEINAKVFVCLCVSIFADCVPYLLRDAVGFFLYLLTGKLCKCRSPPFINLIKKIQIDRRKEKWQNAQKEENIRIILIH